MRHLLNLFVMVLVLGSAAVANGATWHVIPGGGGDATTIQAGINLASNGDVVLVAPGTYTGAGNRNVNFSGKNITVTTELGAQMTIIDCQSGGWGFTFNTNETTSAVLEGFTIKNGLAPKGAGIMIDTASPTIRFNVITNCYASANGGGIYVKKGDPSIYNNTLDGNGALLSGGGVLLGAQSHAHLWQNIVCHSTAGAAITCAGAMTGTTMACNDVYGNTGGDAICIGDAGNNISTDPLYCGIAGSGNFTLQETSPCVAIYSPCLASVGAFGPQCQVTATEAVTWGKVKSMYR
jgi:parallel beta-helix repeat protein